MTDIVASVEAFAGNAPQFDDITCVVFRFKEPAQEEAASIDSTGFGDGAEDGAG